jgi:non-homologous end joining protein Ku
MYVNRAYYLAPDGKMAADAFAVMREGMKGKVGIGNSRSTAGSTSSPSGRRTAA